MVIVVNPRVAITLPQQESSTNQQEAEIEQPQMERDEMEEEQQLAVGVRMPTGQSTREGLEARDLSLRSLFELAPSIHSARWLLRAD